MNKSVENITEQSCTGCKMCMDVCPTGAISFRIDQKGFWYPQIDNEKCTNCGLCQKKCPSINEITKKDNKTPEVYSLWTKDDDIRISSTSGGVFWEVAKWFINNDGVVAGARYGDDWRSANHYIAGTMDELSALKGSKYFQSDTAGIYKQVKDYLIKGVKVLFCGTPCQTAALYSFLNEEYENLYTMDFICRSINSPKAFKAYIDELENAYGANVVEVHLKDKQNGWRSLASRVAFSNGKVSLKDKNSDYWVRGFIANDLFTRECCFNCKYKVIPRRSSDLTIGDFWGIRDQKEEDLFKGISVLLVNSEKGSQLFDRVKDQFVCEQRRIEDVMPGNPALLNNPIRSEKEDLFFKLLNAGTDFSKAVQQCIRSKKKNSITKLLKRAKKVKKMLWDDQISLTKFIYYNFFCKHIVRDKRAFLLPHKNAVLNFDKGSKIVIDHGKLELGFNQLKGSHSETHVRLNKNAVWKCKNGALLFYDTVIEVKPNAVFESGFFSMNGGSVIITHKKITLGEDVMIGRNVVIYDSDFHSLYNRDYKILNVPKPVIIEDHVWLTTNIMVQKGVTIGKDSLIAAYTVVNKDIPPHSIAGGKSSGEVIRDWVHWDRKICPLELNDH